jgi:hypothetical protein
MPINKFTTLLDLARQAKIISGETATFDGKIQVGIPFSGYPSGVDTGTTVSLGIVSSEDAVFSGNTGTTIFDVSNTGSTNYSSIFSGYSGSVWTNLLFSGNTSGLTLPITPLSADTQIVGPFWSLTQTGMTGDYIIGTQYTGYSVTYSFFNVSQFGTGFTYSGFTTASQENFSAGTLDYKGPLDYISTKEDASVEGRLTTNKITITNGASSSTIGYVLTQTGENGEGEWLLNSSADTNTFVTGGTLTGTDLTLGWNAGGSANPIDLNGLLFTGNTSGSCITDLYITNLYGCSPITIHDSIQSVTSSATGTTSFAFGFDTKAYGDNSYAGGNRTTANGDNSYAKGEGTVANGDNSYAGGSFSVANGDNSYAGGSFSVTNGDNSFIHSTNSLVTGDRSVVLGGQNITGTTSDTVYVPYLNIKDVTTGTSVTILGITSGGTVIDGSNLYGDICSYCSDTVSGDVNIGTGTTETNSVNTDDTTVDSDPPYTCTLWCVYKGGEQVDSTSDFEVASQYQLGGYTLRCCDTNSLDGGTNYGTPISGETTTSGDTAPNVVSGITRPISVRQSKKIFLRNTHKSDILNSNQNSIVDSTLGRIELSTLSSIITSFNSKIYNSNLSTILSSENGFITNSSNSNIIGSQYSTLSGVTGSTIIGGNNITGTENDTVYVPKLNIDTLGVGASINNLGIDVNGNVVVGGAGGGIPEATTATTTNINFTGQTIYFDSVTPGTGNITNTLTGAKLGLIQKIYHNDGTEPTYPAGWVLMGDAIYFTSTLNIIYAEWAGGTRVEYWYVQEQ